MLVDGGHMLLDSCDFTLQYFDALGELILRYRPQILPGQQGQRIAWPTGEEVVVIHG